MNRSYKFILLAIFISSILISAYFGYSSYEKMEPWMVLFICLVGGFIIGGGFVRHLIDPLEKRSNELELLSRQTLHELNLPVATILANTQMLLKKEENEKNIKRLHRIETASQTLQSLYAELDYTIKKQIYQVDLQMCDLKDLINEKIEVYKEIFSNIHFKADLESFIVKIDTIGFLKVLDNLVHNAVKYSKLDSVVTITLKNMQLHVEDEGIGMEDDFIFKAFESYYQENRDSKGQGLGLGLVKEYCDRYKIKIYLNSKKDEGTKITLDFTGV